MLREWYKMLRRKYYLALLLLLLIPFLFGVGNFFHLSYMIEDNHFESSVLDYCAEMQRLVKYFHFCIVIYLASDTFAGERANGQLRLALVHINHRKRLIWQKAGTTSLVILFFHVLFWGFNMAVYCLCCFKNHVPIVFYDKAASIYICTFGGYFVAFMLCIAIAFVLGLYMKKLYVLSITFILWFICRYIDQLLPLNNILPEFTADQLYQSAVHVSAANAISLLSGMIVSCVLFSIGAHLFNQKDID